MQISNEGLTRMTLGQLLELGLHSKWLNNIRVTHDKAFSKILRGNSVSTTDLLFQVNCIHFDRRLRMLLAFAMKSAKLRNCVKITNFILQDSEKQTTLHKISVQKLLQTLSDTSLKVFSK